MSASSWSLSGMRFTPRLSTLREWESTIEAVPAQLLPTHITSRRPVGAAAWLGSAVCTAARAAGIETGKAGGARTAVRRMPGSTRVSSSRHARTGLHAQDHRGAVAEEPLVGGEADLRVLDLSTLGLAAQLPGDLAHLRQGLGRHRLAEAGQ